MCYSYRDRRMEEEARTKAWEKEERERRKQEKKRRPAERERGLVRA
ncbi:MAG: hypothetical protein H0V21_08915 [Rubrobacter sp.]|nr:hypothetical protein [Rubrobacter sp.]